MTMRIENSPQSIIPRNVADGKRIMACRTLLTMPASQQPELRMMTDMYSSSVTGLMQIFPGLRRPDTRIISNNWEQYNIKQCNNTDPACC